MFFVRNDIINNLSKLCHIIKTEVALYLQHNNNIFLIDALIQVTIQLDALFHRYFLIRRVDLINFIYFIGCKPNSVCRPKLVFCVVLKLGIVLDINWGCSRLLFRISRKAKMILFAKINLFWNVCIVFQLRRNPGSPKITKNKKKLILCTKVFLILLIPTPILY